MLMQSKELKNFRLVGGTALSLHLGHRVSVDIDLFTDAAYGTIDFNVIENFLINTFDCVEGDFGGNAGMGKSFMVGTSPDRLVKLDIYYAMDPFFQSAVTEDGIRLATIEEIIAMKIDVVQRVGRKKDFWDRHELLGKYTIADMIDLHRQRFEWTHDEELIRENFINFDDANLEPDPICMTNKEWLFITDDIATAVAKR
jgi:predicted nucleotidyltransferase component of viral defense system